MFLFQVKFLDGCYSDVPSNTSYLRSDCCCFWCWYCCCCWFYKPINVFRFVLWFVLLCILCLLYLSFFFVLPTTTILLQHRSKFAAILVLCWCWLMYILYHFFSLYFIASNLLPRSETIRFPPNSLLLISLPSSTKLGRTRVQKIYIYFVANPVNQRIYYGKSVVLKWQNIYKIKSF